MDSRLKFFFLTLVLLTPIVSQLLKGLDYEMADEFNTEYYHQQIEDLMLNPIDLNKADINDLERLFWLSDTEIRAILDFKKEHKEINNENIHKLKINDPEFLKNFITTDKRKNVSYSLIARVFYEKARTYDNSFPYKYYQRHTVSNDKISVGLVSAKAAEDEKIINHYSCYFEYSGDNILRQLVIGNYNLSLAQRITFGPMLGFSKGFSGTAGIVVNRNSISPNLSSMRMGGYRGFAMDLRYNSFEIMPFYSDISLDANVKDGLVTSLYTGNHPDGKKKDRLRERLFGTSVKYNYGNSHLGLYWGKFHYNLDFADAGTLSEYRVGGIYWQMYIANLRFFGEFCRTDDQKGFLSGFRWGSGNLSQLILYREYSQFIPVWRGNPFSSSSNFRGEKGVYYGLRYRISKKIVLDSFFDLWGYSYPRYYEKLPIRRSERMLKLSYKDRKNRLVLGLNSRDYEIYRNIEGQPGIHQLQRERYRISWQRKYTCYISGTSSFEYIGEYFPEQKKFEKGVLVHENIRIDLNKFHFTAQVALYHSQVLHYMYEHTVSNYFQTSVLRGDSIYSYLLIGYRVKPDLVLRLKYSCHINDRSTDSYILQLNYKN